MIAPDLFSSVRGIPTTVTSKVERKRVTDLNQMLSEGKSPYAHIREGGSIGDAPEGVKKVDQKANQKSDEEIKDRVWDREPSLYKSNHGGSNKKISGARTAAPSQTYSPSPELLALLSEDMGSYEVVDLPVPVVIPPGHFQCSFCRKIIDGSRATKGNGKVRKVGTVEIQEIEGIMVPVEVVKHISAKVVACPDCSLEIGPLFNRCHMCKGKSPEEIKACIYCKGTKRGEQSSGGQQWPIGD